MTCQISEKVLYYNPNVLPRETDGLVLLFTDHIPRSQNCMKMQFCETCKRCIAKRVTVNGVNSNQAFGDGYKRKIAEWVRKTRRKDGG